MSDGDYYSIHDDLQDKAAGKEKQVIVQPKENEMDDIRRSLKYVLNSLENINRYIRQPNRGGRTYDGEAERRAIIEKFLIDIRDGRASEEDKELITKMFPLAKELK